MARGPPGPCPRRVTSISDVSPGRKDVTLRKLDIKVETVNREPLTLHTDREEDTASVSTATRVMKAIYSVGDTLRRGGHPAASAPGWMGPGRNERVSPVLLAVIQG